MTNLPAPPAAPDHGGPDRDAAGAPPPVAPVVTPDTADLGPEADRPAQHLFPAILYWG